MGWPPPCTSSGMVSALIAALEPEPTPAMQPADNAVIAALLLSLLVMALFTAAGVLRTRARRHPLRVVRWPR